MAHPGKSAKSAAAGEPEQHRFGLIVERMRGQDMSVADALGRLREEPVARVTRGLLQARFGLLAAPMQRAMRDAQAAREALDRSRLGGGRCAQSVIDGDGEKFWRAVAPFRPARHEQQKRRRIRTAGNGKDESTQIFKTGEQRVRFVVADGSLSSGHASDPGQRSCFTLIDACGYLRKTSPSEAQAASFSPKAASDSPSRISASGARALVSYLVETARNASAAS